MFIPDPTFFHPGSRIRTVSIPDPGSPSKNLSILTPKKWFLSSRKYDPGCSSRIPDPGSGCWLLPIPDPGVKKAPDPGSGSATLGIRHWFRQDGLPFLFEKSMDQAGQRNRTLILCSGSGSASFLASRSWIRNTVLIRQNDHGPQKKFFELHVPYIKNQSRLETENFVLLQNILMHAFSLF